MVNICEHISWVDSMAFDGWNRLNTIDKGEGIIKSIGWVIYEDKRILILSAHKASNKQHNGCLKIPKRSILKRKRIKI